MSAHDCPVLILDDGELDDLAVLLGELRVPYRRLRGGEIGDDLDPPHQLLVTTPRRATAARAGAPEGAPAGRPLRIISVEEDSNAMRAMLRRQGFDLLVRRPTHREVWRLLVQRALYQGDERRSDRRVPMGSGVEVDADQPSALLVDLSNRGCHLLLTEEVAAGSRLAFEIPADEPGEAPVRLEGVVVRSATRGSSRFSIGLLFDRTFSDATRAHLGALLNRLSRGESTAIGKTTGLAALPACESPAIPGLTLDDETDPAVPASVEVDLHVSQHERRRHRRGPFLQTVDAVGADRTAVLMGRDLSVSGMRVEPLPELGIGDRFEIAIYGPSQADPYRLKTEVVRDDGEDGLALRFRDVPADVARGLEKLVACLPDVEPLQGGESGALGSVITEVVPARD